MSFWIATLTAAILIFYGIFIAAVSTGLADVTQRVSALIKDTAAVNERLERLDVELPRKIACAERKSVECTQRHFDTTSADIQRLSRELLHLRNQLAGVMNIQKQHRTLQDVGEKMRVDLAESRVKEMVYLRRTAQNLTAALERAEKRQDAAKSESLDEMHELKEMIDDEERKRLDLQNGAERLAFTVNELQREHSLHTGKAITEFDLAVMGADIKRTQCQVETFIQQVKTHAPTAQNLQVIDELQNIRQNLSLIDAIVVALQELAEIHNSSTAKITSLFHEFSEQNLSPSKLVPDNLNTAHTTAQHCQNGTK
ncbi:hypothetical protein C8R43DRAFT_955789 [Mycena crocata]|nr:hypothetical protein C8R43DRAFT_955789 [Mycena crocata]